MGIPCRRTWHCPLDLCFRVLYADGANCQYHLFYLLLVDIRHALIGSFNLLDTEAGLLGSVD